MGEDTRPGVPARPAEIVDLARAVEQAGFDSVWTFDHLLSYEDPAGEPAGTWEAWTLLAAIAAVTERVKLGVLVSCTGFREPIVTAKMAHTLHELTDGRIILGLGAGWHEPEYRAFGIPFDHKVDRFEESMKIIGPLVRTGRSDFSGSYYRTVDGRLLPPASQPTMPILIGGRGPRMLSLVAEHADAWNVAWFGLPGPKFTEAHERALAACADAGRDPATLDVSVGIYVKADDADGPGVVGSVPALREAIAAWREAGVAEILFWMDPPTMERLEILAEAIRGA
jgi:alkanesulfonate monooxygenase SsuD/methylene tetrahydromethanopterin reductase-like flavin-dependent oxidoreductase (luciferase family)